MSQPIMPAHSEKIERYTPAYIFEGLGTRFDVDVSAPVQDCPSKDWCDNFFSLERGEDGLALPWAVKSKHSSLATKAFVWMNPPWHRKGIGRWMTKMRAHQHGIALVRVGTGSRWFQDNPPDAMLLLAGRVQYIRGDGNAERERKGKAEGGLEPSMLLAYGPKAVNTLKNATLEGVFMEAPCKP